MTPQPCTLCGTLTAGSDLCPACTPVVAALVDKLSEYHENPEGTTDQ